MRFRSAAAVGVMLAATGIVPSVGRATTQAGTDVTVCVGPDSVLRSSASGTCPASSQSIVLSGPRMTTTNLGDENGTLGSAQSAIPNLDLRLLPLEQRLAALENADLFEVVDSKNNVIFRVARGRAVLYSGGLPLAAMLGAPKGGEFAARAADGTTSVNFGAQQLSGIRLKQGDTVRVDLLKQELGNYSLKFPLSAGTIAGIGESITQTGALVVGDNVGRKRAALLVDVGKGSATIFNGGGKGVAVLDESVNGGGVLALTDAGSNTVVKMGINDNRYGVVMTFPPGLPYVPRSGLPGSYMLGCASNPSGNICK